MDDEDRKTTLYVLVGAAFAVIAVYTLAKATEPRNAWFWEQLREEGIDPATP